MLLGVPSTEKLASFCFKIKIGRFYSLCSQQEVPLIFIELAPSKTLRIMYFLWKLKLKKKFVYSDTKMHIEVQVALNFVISYLYNKLPRRRVNIFGEELEKALKDKFRGHWYPDRPCRGSAFRCLKTGGPLDPVLERAARESGVPVRDVLEHLPRDLAVWVDPGKTKLLLQ